MADGDVPLLLDEGEDLAEQDEAWKAVEEIFFSIDLLEASIILLKKIAEWKKYPYLFTESAIQRAVSRFIAFYQSCLTNYLLLLSTNYIFSQGMKPNGFH